MNFTSLFFALRRISYSSIKFRDVIDRRKVIKSAPTVNEGTYGEKSFNVDMAMVKPYEDILYPSLNTNNKLYNGVPYKHLPTFNIRVSKNNTIICLTDHKGLPKMIKSCGIEGFKNAKKGTNIAAQTTAISVGAAALENGVKTVKVRIRGLGPGRMSAVKGLQMSGINVVSVTDSTRVSWNPPRPRKARKL